MDRLTEFQKTLYNINWISFHLKKILDETSEKELIENASFLGDTLIKFSLIQVCILNEEFSRLQSFAKDDLLLRNSLTVAEPCLKVLKKWNGLSEFRNSLLAHFNRDSNGNFIPYWRRLAKKDYPISYRDIDFLISTMLLASDIIIYRHQTDLTLARNVLDKERLNHEDQLYNKKTRIDSKEEYIKLSDQIIKEVKLIGERLDKEEKQ